MLRPVVPEERQDHGHRVGVDGNLVLERRLGEQIEHRRHALDRIDREDLRDVGPLGRLAGHIEEHRDRDENRGAGVLQLMTNFGCRVGGVDGRDGATGPRGAVEERGVLRDVGRHEAEGRAGSEPAGGESSGDQLDAIEELGEGLRATAGTIDDRRLVGQLFCHPKRVVSD